MRAARPCKSHRGPVGSAISWSSSVIRGQPMGYATGITSHVITPQAIVRDVFPFGEDPRACGHRFPVIYHDRSGVDIADCAVCNLNRPVFFGLAVKKRDSFAYRGVSGLAGCSSLWSDLWLSVTGWWSWLHHDMGGVYPIVHFLIGSSLRVATKIRRELRREWHVAGGLVAGGLVVGIFCKHAAATLAFKGLAFDFMLVPAN